MNKKFYAFVGPAGKFTRVFEEAPSDKKRHNKAIEIELTEEQYNLVCTLKEAGRQPVWKDNNIVSL